MRLFVQASLAFALLAGCGGTTGLPTPAGTATPTPSPTPSPTPTPTPTPTFSLLGTADAFSNDGYVRSAAVPSVDSAVYGRRTFQGIPAIARVGSRIWVTWYGDILNPGDEHAGNFVLLSYSDDGGATWSRDYYLVPQNATTTRVFDPRLWLAPDGKLWVLYAQGGNGVINDGQFGVWATIISNPLAATPTFDPGFWLTDGIPGRPFEYRGEWIIPIDRWRGGARFPERAGKFLYRVDWRNNRFFHLTTLPVGPEPLIDETTAVVLRNGGILAQWRTRSQIAQSRTAPLSFNWSTAEFFTALPSIPSRHAIARTPSGRLVMVLNQRLSGNLRTDMTIALSDDDGVTWPHRVVFDTRMQISYPDIDFTSDGKILVVYDFARYHTKQIVLAVFDEADIVAGNGKVQTFVVDQGQ